MITDLGTKAILGYSPALIEKNMKTIDPNAHYSRRVSLFLTLMGDRATQERLSKATEGLKNAVLGNSRSGTKVITIKTLEHEMIGYLVYPEKIDKDKKYPVILFSHGGGFELWSFKEYESFCCELADETDSCVFFYEYRKAPKFKYPAGVNDTFEAYKWLMDDNNCATWHLDNDNFVFAGDSSGANYMSGLAIRIAEEGLKNAKGVLLLYPSVDVSGSMNYSRLVFSGLEESPPPYIDDFKYLVSVSNKYLEKKEDAYKPYASPLIMLEGLIESPGFENQFAPYKARLSLPLKNFPEHLICVAEIDTLRDEGKMYYALLRIFGAEATLHEYPGMFHGFTMANVAFAQSQQCMDDCIEFINKIFYDKK